MSLERKLTFLLAAFAVFALAAAFGTVYAVRWHTATAMSQLQHGLDQVAWTERVQLEAREQYVRLGELTSGARHNDELYRAGLNAFFTELEELARLLERTGRGPEGEELGELVTQLRTEFEECVRLAGSGEDTEARTALESSIRNRLAPALDLRLRSARSLLDAARGHSVDDVVATNTQLLTLAVCISAFGVALVLSGIALFRRWVMVPVRELRTATQEFRAGNLEYRVRSRAGDELGALATAMNSMADALAEAQRDLRGSEEKYRSLFENLRDAAVLADATGTVLECHPGNSDLLTAAEPALARPLLEVWPHWQAAPLDWAALISRVLLSGHSLRVPELRLPRAAGGEPDLVDLVACPITVRGARCVALVLRDVTERHRLERHARRADAMQATLTFARGVAHDFNNLLTSAINSLRLIAPGTGELKAADRVSRALRACTQAAGLARHLLSFAGDNAGSPQRLSIRDTIELILTSFDEEFFAGVTVRTELDPQLELLIDPDQFTQLVLNLVRNAREAMPGGGTLTLRAAPGPSAEGLEGSATHAVLTFADTGCGVTPEVAERMFEPFYTTKAARGARRRGMGLTVVYAVVKNANGVLTVHGTPGQGTTFRVAFPLPGPHATSPSGPPPAGRVLALLPGQRS